MTDKKISQLDAIDSVTGVDLLAIVDDPAGTPATKKATAAQVKDYIIGLANTWSQNQTFSGGVNKVTITAPATGSTLTIADGKTLTANNTLTLAGTDSTTMTFPSTSATLARTDAANSFTGNQTLESTAELLWSTDLRLTRRNTANLRLGAADAASPVAQTLSVQSVVAGTSNTAGTNLTITGSQGTGTGAGGSIIFQVAPAGVTSGTAQNALADALTLSAVTGGGRLTLRSNSTTSFLEVQGAGVEGFNINNRVQIGGGADFTFYVASTSSIGWSAGTNVTSGVSDTRLWRDATYTLALRNGNNGQTFRLYGRFTDITNDFERFFINAPTTSGAAVQLGTQKGATTGAARALELQTDGTTRLTIAATTGAVTFTGAVSGVTSLTTSGAILCGSYQEVRSGALGGNNGFYFVNSANAQIQAPASGVIALANFAGTDFSRLQFGGTTSSFPALKRDSATLQVRLADDSGDADLSAKALTLSGNLTISTKDIVTDTTTGTKIGTGTTQKIGFYNKTPVVQPTAVADATDAATVITQLNALLSRMRDLGLIAT